MTKAREQFVIKHPGQADKVAGWDDRTLPQQGPSPEAGSRVRTPRSCCSGAVSRRRCSRRAVAKISSILKDADNRELDYEHIGPPFLLAGDRLLKRIRNLIVRALPSGTLFPAGNHPVPTRG